MLPLPPATKKRLGLAMAKRAGADGPGMSGRPQLQTIAKGGEQMQIIGQLLTGRLLTDRGYSVLFIILGAILALISA